MDHVYIWWLDKWHLMATQMVLEEAERANVNTPVLPGHIQMALRQADDHYYGGQLYPPVTLSIIDRDHLNYIGDEPSLVKIFSNGWFGIPFEEVHLPTMRQYPGILTSFSLKAIR